MGFHVNAEQFDTWLTEQQKHCDIYAPNASRGATPLYSHWKIRGRNTAPYGFA